MKQKKAIILFGTVCILNTMIAGCGSGSESTAKTEETQVEEAAPDFLKKSYFCSMEFIIFKAAFHFNGHMLFQVLKSGLFDKS